MTHEGVLTVSVIGLVIVVLMTNRVAVDLAMIGGLTLLMLLKVIDPLTAVSGFAHTSIMMIGALFVIAAGLQETGGMEALAQRLLGRPRTIWRAQLRLMAPVALMSGFMNNTPIVAMYLPIVNDWARKLRISPSKLYMPLSFAAILGGKLSYIGTASNILVMGLYVEHLAAAGEPALSPALRFWGVAALGLPTAVAGIAFVLLASRWLLPVRRPADPMTHDARRYQVEMEIQAGSPIIGKTIEDAGLRHLPGLFLTEIERQGDRLPAVSPMERLQAGDRLLFAGVVESVVDLRKIRGLVPATDQVSKVAADRRQRTLAEAVVSSGSPLVGKSVRASQFRTRYNAAIIAVHRAGEHINAKIGDITLQPGDTLLLDTDQGFVKAYRNSDDFYLVSRVEGSRPIRYERAGLAMGILGALVALLALGGSFIHPIVAAFTCALAMVGTRCVSTAIARSAIRWEVLIVIAAALGIGTAMRETGAAEAIASGLITTCEDLGLTGSPRVMLLVMFLITAVFAQLITNNGAAVIMFPITISTAQSLGVSELPFVISLMVACGLVFMSPVGYQTNLMVYGPGGYRFWDFVRLGAPLTLLVALISAVVAPWFFPF